MTNSEVVFLARYGLKVIKISGMILSRIVAVSAKTLRKVTTGRGWCDMTTKDRDQVATNTARRASWGTNIPRVDQDDKPKAGRSADMQTGFGRSRGR